MWARPVVRDRVVVLDDDPRNRERWSDFLTVGGFEPIPVGAPAPRLATLDAFLAEQHAVSVVCDNRLFEHNYANYYGAEAVAQTVRHGLGGVLITAFDAADVETYIRPFRRWIPELVHATELDSARLAGALSQAVREARGEYVAEDRMPYRTLMTVREIVRRGAIEIVRVVMSQWHPDQEIGFPLTMVPEAFRRDTRAGSLLIARVNIGAERPEDLYFDEFELPNAHALDRARTLFDPA